jgi:hypothetical protein
VEWYWLLEAAGAVSVLALCKRVAETIRVADHALIAMQWRLGVGIAVAPVGHPGERDGYRLPALRVLALVADVLAVAAQKAVHCLFADEVS